MSLTVGPERYSAPPVETWMMPSQPASAKPCRAAFSVCDDDHVDRRVGERAGLGAVEHLGVDLGGGDGHDGAPWLFWIVRCLEPGVRGSTRTALSCNGVSSQRSRLV